MIEAPRSSRCADVCPSGATSQTIEEWSLDGTQRVTLFQLPHSDARAVITSAGTSVPTDVITRIGLRPDPCCSGRR